MPEEIIEQKYILHSQPQTSSLLETHGLTNQALSKPWLECGTNREQNGFFSGPTVELTRFIVCHSNNLLSRA